MTEERMDDDALWLDAALDDELDPARSLALARRLERDPAFRERFSARRALRDAVRGQATRHAAPADLRARIAAMVAEEPAQAPAVSPATPVPDTPGPVPGGPAPVQGSRASVPRPRARWRLQGLAAWLSGAAFGAAGASFATWLLIGGPALRPHAGAEVVAQADAAAEAVSAHTRSLLVGEPIEVASSDQHTVRPWLSARLNFVPPIVDFAPQGFALVGARRDVIAGEIAATLVYRHGAHSMSVFIEPARPGEDEGDPVRRVVRGFNVLELTHAGMDWRLVSDMNPAEMAQFAQLLRKNT